LALTAIECLAGANPPSAVAVIQWAKPFQPLDTVPEPIQRELAGTLGKWSARWQKQLAGENLPPILNDTVQAKLAKSANQSTEQTTTSAISAHPREPAQHPRLHTRHAESHQSGQPSVSAPGPSRPEKLQRQRPEKAVPTHHRPGQELSDLLKQIEAQFNYLREELQTAKHQLRQSHQPVRQAETHSTETGKEVGKLREENARLTESVRALRETLNDLASQNFDQAVSRKADTEAPVTDPVDQYRSLLTLRLREQIVNFQTLNRENHIDGLPLLLDNILRTLQENGIDLENIEAPPPQARRRY
jgi:hypothetical protein